MLLQRKTMAFPDGLWGRRGRAARSFCTRRAPFVRSNGYAREAETKSELQVKRLTFRFEGGEAERRLTLLYFRPGLRWIPSYRIELPAAVDARGVVLQGELLNEAEDLVQVPIDLVVGVPNFRFREVVSPFVLEPALRRALAEAAPSSWARWR